MQEKNLIKTNWADNHPFEIKILKDGYLYEEHVKEKQENTMSEFEKELAELIERGKFFNTLVVQRNSHDELDDILLQRQIWMNDVFIFHNRYLKRHALGAFIENTLNNEDNQIILIRDVLSSLISISKDKSFIGTMHKNDEILRQIKVNSESKFDVFISHANSDKIAIVDEMNESLEKLGIRIFYDKKTLEWGDHWKSRILEGTQKAEFAIIVISENFFDREWTEKELNEFLNRQNSNGQKLILPILHNITITQLQEKYPSVADIQGISTKDYTCDQIALLFARQLIKRLRLAHIQ